MGGVRDGAQGVGRHDVLRTGSGQRADGPAQADRSRPGGIRGRWTRGPGRAGRAVIGIDLSEKRALVTGGNRGIGRAIAEALAESGADVAVFARSEGSVREAAEAIVGRGVRSLALVGDVSSATDVGRAWDDVTEAWEGLDILVNNAGMTRDNLLLRMKDEEWEDVLAVNLSGAFHWCRLAVRSMIRQRYGRILNVSSVVGLTGNPGQSNYAASKAGLIGFTKSLAAEVAARGVTANAIAPGYIETEMTGAIGEAAKADYASRIPAGRLGDPRDVANLAVFIASPLAGYITGQVICVDGGLTR
ncbi:MAG: 3-oxoacyl-[acyl-carrier-protein] reductase [Gemmatimonadetes bacterium]|nr:3-oxoacyl-[acyl-carrier-protein] reductase [Gemmatimonadota bacterium]